MNDRIRQATRLWTLAQPSVSAFISSVVREFRDRDDVLQDVAVAVMESFDLWNPERPFTAWAMGVARNQIGLYLRRRRRDSRVLSVDDQALDSLAAAFAAVAPEQTRRLDFLSDCLKTLNGRARTMCELRYQQDLKPGEIAETIGMTANAVAKSLQRIREQLRECIELKVISESAASDRMTAQLSNRLNAAGDRIEDLTYNRVRLVPERPPEGTPQ